MAPYLPEILAAHRRAAALDRRDLGELESLAAASPPPGAFGEAILESCRRARCDGGGSAGGLAVIAEIKRRSPSRGDLAPGLDPATVALAYAEGGAACLSVLTDRDYFGGTPEDLCAARAASGLPTLRKDFTVSAADVCDARLMGADAVLLIMAALDDGELASLAALARRLGLDAIVEVHDEGELDRALSAGAAIVGVNQRDLTTFRVDPARAERLAPRIPDGVVAVAESGISGPQDARRLAAAGYHAILVGESVVTAHDPAAAVTALRGHPVGERRPRHEHMAKLVR